MTTRTNYRGIWITHEGPFSFLTSELLDGMNWFTSLADVHVAIDAACEGGDPTEYISTIRTEAGDPIKAAQAPGAIVTDRAAEDSWTRGAVKATSEIPPFRFVQ